MRVEAVDAAGNVGSVTHESMSTTMHPQSRAPGLEGGEGWRAVTTSPWMGESDWPGVADRACAVPALRRGRVAARAAVTVRTSCRATAGPGAGGVHARVWLEDAAGNHDAERASDPISLRFDDEAPTAAFEPSDGSDSLTVVASVADRGAGVIAGSIELAEPGESVWRDLAATLNGDRLVGTLDDASLPDGVYEIRAHLRDGAGNERMADWRRDGSPMLESLPARAATRIVLAERMRCKRRRGGRLCCVPDRGPIRGNGNTIRGELLAGTAPLPRRRSS